MYVYTSTVYSNPGKRTSFINNRHYRYNAEFSKTRKQYIIPKNSDKVMRIFTTENYTNELRNFTDS